MELIFCPKGILSCFLRKSNENNKIIIPLTLQTGDTPLHLAAREGHIAVVQQLLSSGHVDTFIRNVHGHTPVMEAKHAKRNSEIVEMLISSYGDFPVHLFKKVVIIGSSGVGKSTLAQVKDLDRINLLCILTHVYIFVYNMCLFCMYVVCIYLQHTTSH